MLPVIDPESPAPPTSAASTAAAETAPPWSPTALAGRLVELSSRGGSASLTLAADLIWKAQLEAEPSAWISARPSRFFPPDFAAAGIDLTALPVIATTDATAAARAADRLLRSGAFGLLVLDLGPFPALPTALLSRLSALARRHGAAVVLLTEKPDEASSLGPLVSLRLRAIRTRKSRDHFSCCVEAVKDKRRGPGWSHAESCRGPAGLR